MIIGSSAASALESFSSCDENVSSASECDIGKLISKHVDLRKLGQDDKYRVLTTEPKSDTLSYPRTRPRVSGAYRQFQPAWLKQHPWLHYSHHVDGVYCRACVFFAPNVVGGHTPGKFVTKPFCSWIKMSQKATAHFKQGYHLGSMAKMSEFLARYNNPSLAIDSHG